MEPKEQTDKWRLRLYISGQSKRSIAAIANIHSLCARLVAGLFQLEVIDILENPSIIQEDRLIAVPMLVRVEPLPVRRIIGDFSDPNATAVALNLRAAPTDPA